MRAVHVFVRGQVQGVGFRWFARRLADVHGVSGWCRNLRDGRVELVACADGADLAVFLDGIAEGPPSGRVDDLSVTPWSDPVGPGFEVRNTA